MKKLIGLIGLIAGALALSGCATLGNGVATGEVEAGNAYTIAKLNKLDGSPAGYAAQKQAVADFQRVGADLQSFAAGKLGAYELGNVLDQLKADKVALSNNQGAVDQISTLLNLFSQQVNALPNGAVSPQVALAQGVVTNVIAGFNVAILYEEGKWGRQNPAGWPAPAN